MAASALAPAARPRLVTLSVSVILASAGAGACASPDDVVARARVLAVSPMGGAGGAGGSGGGPPTTFDCVRPALASANAPDVVALYGFEDANGASSVADSAGRQPGLVVGGTFVAEVGPTGCGQALALGTEQRRVVLPDNPAWDLDTGSIDFWFRVPSEVTEALALLGRDQQGTDFPGHLSIWLTAQRTVTLRLQGAMQHSVRCSAAPLEPGAWVHVGFNFGPPGTALYVNSVVAERIGDPQVETVIPECGTESVDGIAGNELDWLLGSDTARTTQPLVDVQRHFRGGALDALRISNERRAYERL